MAGTELLRGERYLRVKLGLPSSDGARVLERHLGERRAWAYALEMWDWFARDHPEGELTGPDAAFLIARGAGWQGEWDKFCAAMVTAEFLAPVTEGFRVRGWEKWAGYYFTVKAKEKAKKKEQRKPESQGQAEGCIGDVPGMSRGQVPENKTPEGVCPRDPSHISSVSSSVSEGVQGEAAPTIRRTPVRARLVSPFGAADPFPNVTAVLAALWDRGVDAAPPSEKSAPRVEAAVVSATIPVAVERLAVVYANPDAKKPLTYHTSAIRGVADRPSADNGRPDVSQMDYSKPPPL